MEQDESPSEALIYKQSVPPAIGQRESRQAAVKAYFNERCPLMDAESWNIVAQEVLADLAEAGEGVSHD